MGEALTVGCCGENNGEGIGLKSAAEIKWLSWLQDSLSITAFQLISM